MWTVCWTNKDGIDLWDRFEDEEVMRNELEEIAYRNGYSSQDMKDNVLVFPPDSEWDGV